VVAAGNDALFAKLCQTLERSELAADARFSTNAARSAHVDALKAEIERALAARPATDWLEALAAAGIPCGPINTVADVVADPQVAARNMVVGAEGAGGARLRMAGNPIKMSAFADPPERNRVPGLDGDRAGILAEFADR